MRADAEAKTLWHEHRLDERIGKVRRVLRVKEERGLLTVSIERYRDAVALVNELLAAARPDRREGALPDPETEALRAELGRVTAERNDTWADFRESVEANGAIVKRADAAEAEVVRLTRELEVARSLTERATRAEVGERKPVVFLAGPYSKPNPAHNMHAAIKLANTLMPFCTPVVPHLTGFWDAVSPKPHDEWLQYDLELMYLCDVVHRFGGASPGADAEVAAAIAAGIPITTTEYELKTWLNRASQPEAERASKAESGVGGASS